MLTAADEVPAGQALQLDAPLELENVPDGQLVQEVAPATEKEPGEQFLH
jgi:hypothetical protein